MSHVSLVQTSFKPGCKLSPHFSFGAGILEHEVKSAERCSEKYCSKNKLTNKLTGDYVTITVFRFVVRCNLIGREHASRQFLQRSG